MPAGILHSTGRWEIPSFIPLPLALSYDHRIIDGGAAARFMLDLVQGFEKYAETSVKLA